ncbi:Uncharacterised protein [Achromobacter sp. 2789STDY5608621]|jgi:hypothetical protein|nr:Uncharacterised protein [Achromobacter sp. 2789STDY5608621]
MQSAGQLLSASRHGHVDTTSRPGDIESHRVDKAERPVDVSSRAVHLQRGNRQNRPFVYADNIRQGPNRRGLSPTGRFRCRTKENSSTREKQKQIKEITAPAGCVLCGDLKGPDAALAAGALRVPVSVRGTLTTSDGRPRRRSRWDQPPRSKPLPPQSKWATRRWPICFGAGLSRWHSPALVRSTGESQASPSRHCSCVSATPAQSP